ncbi:MAG: hypothetical protein NTY19_31390 [Planctomycetota bacterium]|nr:hypothetical protein [Planctomycetota bacterium]
MQTTSTSRPRNRRRQRIAAAVVWCVAPCLVACTTWAAEAARDGLVLEYRFEGNSADSSGHKHDGTLHGKPRFVAGRVGQCLALSGDLDYVDCGTTLADLGQTFTVECWVNPADKQPLHADIFGNHAHGGSGFVVEQDGANTNQFLGGFGAGAERWVVTRPVQITAGKWQHLALVRTPGELRLYLNGIPAAVSKQQAVMRASPNTLRVGDSIADVQRCFRGQIDEFRVWSKALTEFDLGLSPEEKLELFAQAVRVQFRAAAPGQAPAAAKDTWGLALDELLVPCLPADAQEIVLELTAEDWRGGVPTSLPPVKLAKSAAFKADIRPALPPGYYLVRCRPSLVVGTRQVAGQTNEFSAPVYGPPPVAGSKVPPPAPRESGHEQPTQVLPLDGLGWLVATDPKNAGREQNWQQAPVKEAQPTRVPDAIQDVFPGYHGVAWYWRDFTAPAHCRPEGHYLLRFHAVDYLAEVWVNDSRVGSHEGGETPFVLDATAAVRPGQTNRLAVRVLNPAYEPIDGISLKQTASGAKQYPVATNSVYNCGGIMDAVELLLTPAVRIEDLQVLPDWKTGEIHVRAGVRNFGKEAVPGFVQLTVAPAAGGESLGHQVLASAFLPGQTLVAGRLRVENPRLWRLNDPCLYRVTARAQAAGSPAFDEQSVRCGFRDFRFERGYFRLNGERIFLNGNIHLAHYPFSYTFPSDPELLRRDVLHMKTLGINLCRFAFGGSLARQLDVFDELGVMVYMEHYASWQLQDSPQMKRRFERSLGEIVLRDRNHPSVVTWGILNETAASDPAFRHGVQSLPLIRWLDPQRMCVLNSGRWDGDATLGSVSNPGSDTWDGDLRDVHGYPPVPHRAELLRSMRTSATPGGLWSGAVEARPPDAPQASLFVSEYGQCGALDLVRTVRLYEQRGQTQSDEGRYYRRQLDKFLADWQAWQLDQVWPRPEDFFLESHRNFAKLRRIGQNALRANPHLVAFSSTYPIADLSFCGAGVANVFRELKPGLADTMFELAAPLRWCLFVEPANVARGQRVKLEAVLVNEDKLGPGKYPVRLQVVGPQTRRVWEQTVTLEVPPRCAGKEPPFAVPVATADVVVDGPAGPYRFLATMLQGGAPQGGETGFYVSDPAEMPAVVREIVLWGEDAELRKWLATSGIRTRESAPGRSTAREVILVSGKPPAPGGATVFNELVRQIARGSSVVFLDPGSLRDGQQATRWLPLPHKGRLAPINWVGGYYRADMWAKRHPIFDGLPSGGILDPTFYRELLPQDAFLHCHTIGRGFTEEEATAELDQPTEAVCGANRLSANYASGLHVAVYRLGAGRFILNNLLVRENLGRVPPAERLLRNMLNHAAQDVEQPLADLPADFDAQLKTLEY